MRMMIRLAVVVGLAAATCFTLGCESSQKSGGAAGMNGALADYNAQRFAQAREKADAVQNQSTVPNQREEAAYLGGLAAYQLGDLDGAERRFMVSTRSSSGQTAAKSKAMMGQIRMDQGRPRDAAAYFVDAQPLLTGDDAELCAYNASVAYQQSGDTNSAKTWMAKSGNLVPGRSTYSAPPSGSGTTVARSNTTTGGSNASSATGFTLQVGAFKEKTRAQQAAADAQKLASRDGLGSVKILTRKDNRGSTMYVVQFGRFATREAAAAARSKLNRLNYIVAPA